MRSFGKDAWNLVNDHADKESTQQIPGDDVLDLLELRKQARNDQNWDEADKIRERILKRGWKVKDTPDGQVLSFQNDKQEHDH